MPWRLFKPQLKRVPPMLEDCIMRDSFAYRSLGRTWTALTTTWSATQMARLLY